MWSNGRVVRATQLAMMATTVGFKLISRNASTCEQQHPTIARKIELKIDSTLKEEVDPHKRKRNAAKFVVNSFVRKDMTIGMGGGPMSYFVVEQLGESLKRGEHNMEGVRVIASNSNLERHLISLQIPTTQLSSVDVDSPVDLLIDGADEVSACVYSLLATCL